jgi:hypothetical protein
MTAITNQQRADWAQKSIEMFATTVKGLESTLEMEDAQDLVTNIIHHLRLNCGLQFEEAVMIIHMAVNMAEAETEQEDDQ